MRAEELDEIVVKNIIAFREALGLSQRQFALKADIEPSYLNKIEKFAMSPSNSNVQKISEAYNVDPSVFYKAFKGKESKNRIKAKMLLDSTKEEWKLELICSLIRQVYSCTNTKKK